MKHLATFIFVFLVASNLFATTYYVDFDAGSDAAAGTSTGTAWRTLPGTRKADDTGYLNTTWGSFTTSAKVPDNTTFEIKAGTVMDSTDGGYVWFANSSGFYASAASNIVVEVSTNWGTGSTAVYDASGMTVGIAALLIQVSGIHVRGLIVANSTRDGIQAKEQAGTSAALTNIVLADLILSNNCTIASNDLSGSGLANIHFRKGENETITNCVIKGNNRWGQGILLGESHMSVNNGFVLSCVISNMQGDVPNNDAGIGIKGLNSKFTVSNCVSMYNLKGADLGENNGDGSNMTYTILNSSFCSNYWGINFNGAGTYTNENFVGYLNNCLVGTNSYQGVHIYSPTYAIYVTHCILRDNGNAAGNNNGANITLTADSATESYRGIVYLLNTIGLDPYYVQIENSHFNLATNDITLISDYNSWRQRSAESFAQWAFSDASGENKTFSYGANGPGHASGNWYSWYGGTTTAPTNGTGHFHADANSTGTGADNTSIPTLDSSLKPTATFAGANLTSSNWFQSFMGVDRAGKTRSEWTRGMYEFVQAITNHIDTMSIGSATILQ